MGEDLERELKSVDEDFFIHTRELIANSLRVGKTKDALKKPAGMRAYVEKAFAEGKLPSAITEIVGVVTDLRASVS